MQCIWLNPTAREINVPNCWRCSVKPPMGASVLCHVFVSLGNAGAKFAVELRGVSTLPDGLFLQTGMYGFIAL